jgi:3-deoxy-D-manno-octulosonate 8-phosphate phosphatase (KDO 8-P phosphatase)
LAGKSNLLKEKIKKIKLVITDIDGVWTDGGLYYTTDGHVMKRFQVKDGMAVSLLRKKGIEVAIVSGDASEITVIRGQKLKVELLYKNISDKKKVLDEICSLRNLEYKNIAYIGDDINDLEVMKLVSMSAAPSDAVKDILKIVDYKCKLKGGHGAFREFADYIISNLD